MENSNYNNRPEVTADSLLERLSEVYRTYMGQDKNQPQKKRRITRLFRRWFMSFDPTATDSMHQNFLDEVAHVVDQLAISLKQLKQDDPDKCKVYAAQAANIILAPKPTGEKTMAEWYMTIAEYQSATILPYLAADKLREIRDTWIIRTPKRLMYPKQRALLDDMEQLLSIK